MKRAKRYDARWTEVGDLVARVLDSGERDLSRAVRLVEAGWRSTDSQPTRPTRGTAFGTAVVLPHAALIGGRRDLFVQVLIEACTEETGLVVELGSGWGHNLLNLYLAGGPRVPYYALEPSPAGRACVELLAGLEPETEIRSLPFDLEHPHYDLPSDNEHVLVFTVHSIEQIPELPREALTGLFALGRALTVVHLEPLGWQIGDSTEQSRRYALRKNYNRNLWALLKELEEAGEITIADVVPDLISHKPYIASSLVVWKR